jgi:hypothetical protein
MADVPAGTTLCRCFGLDLGATIALRTLANAQRGREFSFSCGVVIMGRRKWRLTRGA